LGFRASFRRNDFSFSWTGTRKAIERLNEAVAEIERMARADPALAGEGAVLLLEKLSPAVGGARDHLESQPAFALEVALAALYWMARGEGHELTGAGVAAAGDHAAAAAAALGAGALVGERIAANVAGDAPAARWVRQCLEFDATFRYDTAGLSSAPYTGRAVTESEHLDPGQLTHATVEGSREVAAMAGMLGGDQAVGEAAGVLLEHLGRLLHRFTVLERKCNLVQKTANRDQLGGLVLIEGRPQGPYSFRQDHVGHQQ